MTVLGIESSCDETSVAVIKNGELTSNLISSQLFHNKFGGVVPELSSRAHIQKIVPLLKQSIEESSISKEEIDCICATAGPGLIGALLVGFTFGKGLAVSLNKPFIPVNHIEGHLFSGFLSKEKPEYPFLSLVVSGGHTILFYVKSPVELIKLGSTVDDAAGEAFDKVSKMLGFGYPGGPKIQKHAELGDANKILFPVADLKKPFHFSFSGLKTAVLRYIQSKGSDVTEISEDEKNDIAASFQYAVIKALIIETGKAAKEFPVKSLVLAGGVAANSVLRNSFIELGNKLNIKTVIPAFQFCGDNAAMIAYRGYTLFNEGLSFPIDYKPYAGFKSEYLSF